MKAVLCVFCCFCLCWFIGCKSASESNTGQGIISFYTGEIDLGKVISQQPWPFDNTGRELTNTTWSSSYDSIPPPWLFYNTVNEGYIYLKKIEISTTGREWVTLINETEAIPMHFKYEGELIRIPIEESVVPVGEYHGLRISIEPRIRILSLGNLTPMDTILNQEPAAIYVRMGMSQLRSSVDSLEFTSANGYLIPFTVTEEEETRIILHIVAAADGDEATYTINRWWTDVVARATKFIF